MHSCSAFSLRGREEMQRLAFNIAKIGTIVNFQSSIEKSFPEHRNYLLVLQITYYARRTEQ